MPNVFEKKPLISDVLKWEADFKFCREAMTVSVPEGGTETVVTCGETYVQATGAKVTDDTFTCIALANATIAPGTSEKVLCLVRGPALVDPANIRTDLDETELKAALGALNIQFMPEPAVLGIQTT